MSEILQAEGRPESWLPFIWGAALTNDLTFKFLRLFMPAKARLTAERQRRLSVLNCASCAALLATLNPYDSDKFLHGHESTLLEHEAKH